MKSKQRYEGKATRSALSERYDLIPPEGIEACARRMAIGSRIHGARNWEGGGREFAEATRNHLLRHASRLASADFVTEDLDAVICNAMMLARFRSKGII